MSNINIEGFFGNPFFVALKIQQEDNEQEHKRIKEILKDIIKREYFKDVDSLYYSILLIYYKRHKIDRETQVKFKEPYLSLVKEIVIKYLIEEGALIYYCKTEEEQDKILELYKRKQFVAKPIKLIMNRVSDFVNRVSSHDTDLPLILEREIENRITDVNNKYIIEIMGPLKSIVDVVASGVKNECYLEFEKGYCHYTSEELDNYIYTKHGYDYRENYSSPSLLFSKETDDKLLSFSVVEKEDFWSFDYNKKFSKSILNFAHLVVKHNDVKHAEKIIDYAFQQVCKDPICKYLYDNKLPLYLSLSPQKRMLNWCLKRLTNCLSAITNKTVEESDYKGFLYPLYDGYEDKILKGKEIFQAFLKHTYPNDYEFICNLFENPDNVIQEENINLNRRKLTLKMMLESEYFTYEVSSDLAKFMYGYYKNYGTKDAILGRMYYRCYIIDKLTNPVTKESLYEIFFDIFNMIDYKYSTKSSYVYNYELRDENFFKLMKLLKNYGFNIKETYKDKYITALLDRKYATYEETQIFPQLEQFGDAIYELAVDNILFYNPKTKLNHSTREALVKADAQIKVSKRIGLNKLYISNLHNSLNLKYLDYEKYDTGLEWDREGNYIADSLEMVIGAIATEFGVQKALDFTTKIILEANPNIETPQFEKFNIASLSNSSIDKNYLDKIYPSPFKLDNDNDYYFEYDAMSYALNKLLKICIIGNDSKEKRRMISFHLDDLLPTSGIRGFYQYVVSYLYYGIEETIEKYRPIVESSYRENK